MKKVLTLLLCIVMVFSLFSCGKEETKPASNYEIAMITTSDTISIDDKSYTQGTFEGLKEYAEENDLTYKYYEPSEDSTDARLEQIDQAVDNGATVIVAVGQKFEEVIATAQEKYADKTFILIDGYPTDKDGKQKTGINTTGVKFANQEAGYLAGYAAVKDGYTKLGFMAESKEPAMKDYSYGFLQGCNNAARDMGITVDINYNYKKSSDTAAKVQKRAESWYKDGTEVIFVCGDSIFDAVASEADIAKAKVIGAGVDMGERSKNVIVSAVKEYAVAVQKELAAYYNGEFAGGENLVLGVNDDAVSLTLKTSGFNTFEQTDYDELYESLKSGKLKIPTNEDAKSVSALVKKTSAYSIRVTAR